MIVNIFDFNGNKIKSVELPMITPIVKGGSSLSNLFEKNEVDNKIIPVYPEDDISDLKEKIFIATNIMPCEQYLFSKDETTIGHSVFISDIPYEIKLPYREKNSEKLGNISIDRNLYNAKNLIRIEDEEFIKADFAQVNLLSLASLLMN